MKKLQLIFALKKPKSTIDFGKKPKTIDFGNQETKIDFCPQETKIIHRNGNPVDLREQRICLQNPSTTHIHSSLSCRAKISETETKTSNTTVILWTLGEKKMGSKWVSEWVSVWGRNMREREKVCLIN
jgi:hypothetical protein